MLTIPELKTGRVSLLSDLIYWLAPFSALLIGIKAIRLYGLQGRQARSLLYLNGGMLCFLLGESIWMIYADILGKDPFPSAADLFFILGYPFLFFGLLEKILSEGIKLSLKKLWPFLLASLALIAAVGYFSIFQAYDSEREALANWFSISYGIGDLILIIAAFFTALVITEYQGGKLAFPWSILVFGFIFLLGADLLFAIYQDAYGEVLSLQMLVDTFWIISYLLFALSFSEFALVAKEKQEKIKAEMEKVAL